MAPPEYPIKVGSMLYTLVDPDKGHEVAYNRWYERDHYYGGCMVGPWLFAGSRWVATRELKDLRFPRDDTNEIAKPYDAGSYVAIYWVHEGKHEEHFAWAGEQVVDLYVNNRGFEQRRHAHTALYDYLDTQYRDDDPVPVELALDHGYAGLVSIAVDIAAGADQEDFDRFNESAGIATVLAGGPVASCASWRPIPLDDTTANAPMDLGTAPGGDDRVMQLFFVESDPGEVWERFEEYASEMNSSGVASIVFAAPFHATIVGTDTYTDELW